MTEFSDLIEITGPATEPLTISDLSTCDYLKGVDLTLTSEIALFNSYLIPSARQTVEGYLDRKLISQTWDIIFDYALDRVDFPFGQLISVTSVKIISDTDTETTDSSSKYSIQTGDNGALWLRQGYSWTTTLRPYRSFKIRFVCGYANAASVPAAIKTAMMMTIANYYEHRETVGTLEPNVKNILLPYKLWRL